MTPEERKAIKDELIELSERLDHDTYLRRWPGGETEWKKPSEKDDRERFAKLLCDNLYYLWD